MSRFSIRLAYKQGFNLLIHNIGSLLAPLAIIFVLYALNARFMSMRMDGVGILTCLLFLFITIVIGLLLTIGIERIGFDLSYRGSTDWRRLFSGYHLIGPFFLSGIFYGLIVLGGMCLLVIPGLIWSIKYCFHDLFIVDTECTAQESISRSGALTDGHKWKLFLFSCVNYLAGLLSFGLLYPVIIFARISVYRQLKGSIN